MAEIFVDDEPYVPACTQGQTVAALASEVSEAVSGDTSRLVVSVWCDGQDVSNDRLDDVLSSPVNRYQRLGFYTQPVAALVEGALTQATALLEDSARACSDAADRLDEGVSDAAMQALKQFIGAFAHVQQAIQICSEALHVELNELASPELDIQAAVDRFKSQLHELKHALEHRDTVAIGDLLRYELEKSFRHWGDILQQLQRRAQLASI